MLWGAVRRLRKSALRWRTELVIFAAVALLTATGLFDGLQNKLDDIGFSLLKRPASGEIVIVQIDPKSLAEIETWPWPRSKHAEVIDRLVKAGADLVGLDIDFSSPSKPDQDSRLAQSIAAASGHVLLPSFVQQTAPGVNSDLIETNPLPAFRNGSLIGNANIFAPEGGVRSGSLGVYLPDGRYRPTFAGLVGQQSDAFITTFDIDFGIDPATFKRLSYVDVLNGTFDPRIVKGKRVIVGATALELGDRVPVPLHTVIAGVELQALIAESVLQGRMLLSPGLAGALVLIALVVGVLRPANAQWSFDNFGRRSLVTAGVLLIGPIFVLMIAPVMLETAPALVASTACVVFVGTREFGARARAILRERSANQLRRAMISLIVEESSDGVVVTDCHGRIELCNERAGHLLNTTRSMLAGRHVAIHLPRFEHMSATDDEQRHADLTVDCNGEALMLELSARRLALKLPNKSWPQDAQIDVYTLRDVTARREAEKAERRAQEEQLTAERAKTNFIANMSHELRTPLNAIIGFSEMIAKQTLGPAGEPKYAEFADLVAKSGHHLLSLINNVLEISRIDAKSEALEIETIDFNVCAESCAALTRKSRDYKGQTIAVQATGGNGHVHADRRLIKHVLINLLSNAVKFSGEGGSIVVSSWTKGDAFGFQVSDDGTGIDSSMMPHLAELFYQPDQSFTRRHDGMGLGLYLVKRYLDLMKGTLEFDSAPGKGTRVRVLLTGAAVPEAASAEAA